MCIDISMRCDGRSDCADESDEKNCNLVFIDKDKYRKESIPKLIGGDAQLNVWVEIDVFGISAIRELKGDFKIDFSLGLTWYDSRLTFQNLKASSNIVNREVGAELWRPPIMFQKAIDKREINMEYDEHAYMVVLKETSGSPNDESFVHEGFVYHGSKNRLGYHRRFLITHSCKFVLTFYPFDTQHCTLEVCTN